MAALTGTLADLYMASGAGVTFTQEVMTDNGDHETYHVATANTAHRYWDDTSALTIEVSTDGGATWAAAAAGTYSVRYVGGVVTFTTVDSTREVRVSCKYLAISQVGQAYDWEVSPTVNILDVTTFSGGGWKQKTAGLHDATAKASRYYLDGTFFGLLGMRFVVIFYPHFSAGERYEAFAYLKSDPIKAGVDAVIDEELDWEIDGQLFFQAS